jgi:hypothetical protein
MRITKRQARTLERHGFKWYKNQTSDRVDPEFIESVRPSEDGFTVIYKDSLDIAFVASIAEVEKIEWRKDPSKEWIFVHYKSINDIKKGGR